MADRILKLRELNRATLARQMLLERETLSAPAAIERLVGLQAQLASAPYVGLWTRLRDFRREDLAQEIENRKVVHWRDYMDSLAVYAVPTGGRPQR